jgi:hypothetical protein
MKKTIIVSSMLVALGTVANAADSSTNATDGSTGNSSITAPATDVDPRERPFEIGAIFGEPTGLSLKYWLSDTMAVDGGLGWSFDDETDVHVHSDVLWHNFEWLPVSEGSLAVYFGVGARAKFRDNRDDLFGIRFPIGLNYLFRDVPVSVFAEVAPVLDLAPSTRGALTAGIGARYRF